MVLVSKILSSLTRNVRNARNLFDNPNFRGNLLNSLVICLNINNGYCIIVKTFSMGNILTKVDPQFGKMEGDQYR